MDVNAVKKKKGDGTTSNKHPGFEIHKRGVTGSETGKKRNVRVNPLIEGYTSAPSAPNARTNTRDGSLDDADANS